MICGESILAQSKFSLLGAFFQALSQCLKILCLLIENVHYLLISCDADAP